MNRILPNVYLVDSGGLWLTHDSSGTGNFLDLQIQTIKFVSGTSGTFELTLDTDTAANVIVKVFNASGGTDFINFPLGFRTENRLFVKTCNVGTAWLYLA